MKRTIFFFTIIGTSILLSFMEKANGQVAMNNVYGRHIINLNGNWKVVIDPFDIGLGDWSAIYKDRKPKGKTDFVDYSFDLGPALSVPGDFNSQLPELTYYESSVWYKLTFLYDPH